MTEVEKSAWMVQKRGNRWCLFHFESGILHERNFPHKAMAKQFGMELTESGFVPEGAEKVAEILEEKPFTEDDVVSVDEPFQEEQPNPPEEERPLKKVVKRRKRRKKK